jgi:predicted metal-dependent peptidase
MTSAQVTQASKEPRMIRVAYPEVKLTPQQARQWSETLAAVNWIGPGFCHLLYSMLNKRDDSQVALFTEAIPCAAATDGIQLLFKPSEFFALTLMERVFAVFHEISHCVGDHCGMGYQMKKRGEIVMGNKKLPYDDTLANIVQDLIINDMLIQSQFGTFKKGWLHDESLATFQDDWVEVYFKMAKKPPPGGGGGKGKGKGKGKAPPGTQSSNDPGNDQGQTMPGPGQFDQHLDPGQSEGVTPEETSPRDVQQWQQAVAEALEVARAQGKCPAAFEAHFGAMLEPKVDWTEHLRALVARKVGSGGFDFRKPDRRLIVRDIVCPGRSGHGAGTIVVALDTSGSIFADPTLLDRWLAELTGIMQDVRPKVVHVVECDADIQRVTELTDASDIAEIQAMKGGGGTSFEPVFDWIEENGISPDCLLYLTDSYGTFPKEAPKYAVVWGDISGEKANYPWGDVVEVPTE